LKATNLRFLQFIPAPAVALAIWLLSSRSSVSLPEDILGIDKIAHCIAYATLAVSVSFLFPCDRFVAAFWRTAFVVFVVTILYGALDEFHQSFVPGRDMSVWDWLADVSGAGVGIIVHRQFSKLKH